MLARVKAWWSQYWPWLLALLATITGVAAYRRSKQRAADHVRALEEIYEGERARERTEKHLREAIDHQTVNALLEQADEHARLSVQAGTRADEAEAIRFSEYDRIKSMSPSERYQERMRQLKARSDAKRTGLRILAFLVALSLPSIAEASLPTAPRGPVTFDAEGKADLPSGRWWIMSEEEQVSLLATGAELEAAISEIKELRDSLREARLTEGSLRNSLDTIQRAHRIATELRLDAQARATEADADRKAAEAKAAQRWRWFGVGVAIGAVAVGGFVLGAR